MTKCIYVGSKANGSVYQVEGNGMTETDARRNAIQICRALYHVVDPVALNDHDAAVRMRQQNMEKYRMPIERVVPFSGQTADVRYRH